MLILLVACRKQSTNPPPVIADNDPVLPGNATNAQSNPALSDNYLKDNIYYKIAYSRSRAEPVWVAWHLQPNDFGTTPRQDDFRPDTDLPSGWYQVQASAFFGTGFDRGHNCPSADRTASIACNSSTFLMSNMIPQAPNLNQGPWAGLEDFIRDSLIGSTNEAYILMGNYGSGGYGSSGAASTLDGGHVIVPLRIYKVVIVIPIGNNDLARINSAATVLAVDMTNDNRLYTTTPTGSKAWRNYLTTVSAIEQDAAGYGITLNIFSNIAASIRSGLKMKTYQ